MNEFERLKLKVEELEKILKFFVLPDRYQFQRDIELLDGRNLRVSQVTGFKIGTAITQKIGVYGVTPIAQRSGSAQTAIDTTASTQTTPWGYSTQAQADSVITLSNELRAWAVAQGFIKGSA